ncbi:MAG TPA: helical backbone metal receptor [Saprospiraceae bacterium]|nr:helical backbone metal receptor [Saprospiraceae bacterium]
MKQFTDQMQRQVSMPVWPPRRIVSLVPSQTEFLAALALDAEVVGITKFCIYPAQWFDQKKRVGGTKTLNLAAITALNPDLIIGNKEENDATQIAALWQDFPVWMSDILTLDDALEMMTQVGAITGREEQAAHICAAVEEDFAGLLPIHPPKRAAYLIWRKPYMVAASGTFIQDMLQKAGFQNVFEHLTRYPAITSEQLQSVNPEVLLLSSEPYPFQEKHLNALQEICPNARIALVNGEMFSWYGSRLLSSAAYFKQLQRALALPGSGQDFIHFPNPGS